MIVDVGVDSSTMIFVTFLLDFIVNANHIFFHVILFAQNLLSNPFWIIPIFLHIIYLFLASVIYLSKNLLNTNMSYSPLHFYKLFFQLLIFTFFLPILIKVILIFTKLQFFFVTFFSIAFLRDISFLILIFPYIRLPTIYFFFLAISQIVYSTLSAIST